MQWLSFAGNRAVKEQVASFAREGRFPHALVLEGPHGSGRRTLARLIAMAAVCTGEGDVPCGVCAACRKAFDGKHPDIQEVGGDGTARSFHISVIRELRDSAYILPNEAPRRVFILREAQAMTEQAQNALLKVLEEPPAQALFLLTCESRAQLLPTVRSRTVCLTLEPVTEQEALPLLRERFPDKPDTVLKEALASFGGYLGQAIDGLQEDSFRQVQETASALVTALIAPDELELLKLTAGFIRDKELLDGVLNTVSLLVRDALVRRFQADSIRLAADGAAVESLAHALTARQLQQVGQQLEQLRRMRLRNMNPTLLATVMCARLRAAAGR